MPQSQTLCNMLKKAILEHTTVSERKRLQVLLSSTELADCRPSQVLRQMQALLGTWVSCFDNSLLKELFIQCPLPMVQMVLASVLELSLSTLAALANKIAPSQLCVAAASSEAHTSSTLAAVLRTNRFPTPKPTSPKQDDTAEIHADIQQLADLVASNLTTRDDDTSVRHFGERRHFGRSTHHSPRTFCRPSSAGQFLESLPACWYH